MSKSLVSSFWSRCFVAKCLWTTLKNNENDGKYRCAGRIQAQGAREFIDILHTILQKKDKKNDA